MVWQWVRPHWNLDLNPKPWRPIIKLAKLTPDVLMQYVDDTPPGQTEKRGAIVLIRGDIPVEIASDLPQKACEEFFYDLFALYKQCGYDPVLAETK